MSLSALLPRAALALVGFVLLFVGSWAMFLVIDGPRSAAGDPRAVPRAAVGGAVLSCAVGATLGIRHLRQRRLRRRRRRAGRCTACGYDLRGGSNRCPECGAATTRLHRADLRTLDVMWKSFDP